MSVLDGFDGLADAFARSRTRPAVFDRDRRTRLGVWWLEQSIPVGDVVAGFADRATFSPDSTDYAVVPLHEAETAEVTGEYLLCRPDAGRVLFYDCSSGGFVETDLPSLARTYPAWRLRFWHPDYDPDVEPSYREDPAAVYDEVFDAAEPVDGSDEPLGDGLFEELRAFVEREREAEREDARRTFETLRPTHYHDEHGGVPHAEPAGRSVDAYGQQVVHLQALSDGEDGRGGKGAGGPGGQGTDRGSPDDIDADDLADATALYPGTEVIVGRLDGDEGFPVEAEILDVDGRQFDLGIYWDRAPDKGSAEAALGADSDARFRIGVLLNPVPFDRETAAIGAVEDSDGKRAVLTGEKSLDFDSEASVTIRTDFLNAHQKRAVRTALCANDVFCIHGPPGTGKTRTLTDLVERAVERGDRVLACAHSNQAVDTLLVGESTPDRVDPASLHAAAQEGELEMARVGDRSENEVVRETYATADPWKADVVGATTSGAHQFGVDEFDLAVLDEASQATIPASLLPMAAGRRLVLAGDHRQLPPYHSSEHSSEEEMELSLFEHLMTRYGDGVSLTLERQYRMNEEIAAFPNEEFYGGLLTHGQRNRTWSVGTLPPIAGVAVDGTETQTPSNSYYNELEAKAVGRYVSQLLFAGLRPRQIGVITAYSGQVGKIRARLADLEAVDRDVDQIHVGTVDSFQGGQRDAIVVSFVRSNPEGFTGFLTFPQEGPRRLNVALTRAKKRLVLVGNWDTLGTVAPDRRPADSCADVYARLADHLADRDRLESFPES